MTPDGLIATASVRLAAAGVETPRAEARRPDAARSDAGCADAGLNPHPDARRCDHRRQSNGDPACTDAGRDPAARIHGVAFADEVRVGGQARQAGPAAPAQGRDAEAQAT